MKKRLCLLLVAVLTFTVLAACGRNATTNDMNGNNGTNGTNDKATNTGKLNDVYQAVKNAYGENYLPNQEIDEETLKNTYGINMDDVVEYKAEVPMISANVDTFIGIEAKEGRADNVEAALNKYRDNLVNNTMQYPVNQPKVEASRVVRSGNYVFFVMLGTTDNKLMESGDEAALKQHAEKQTQIAVDAINSVLSK